MSENKGFALSPRLIGLVILIIAAIVALIIFLTRKPDAPAKPVTPPAVEAVKPVETVKPAETVEPVVQTTTKESSGEWTLAKLEEVVKANTPIYFAKDSTRYLPGEKEKIQRMAEAMSHFKNVHLRFRGHTAAFNKVEFRKALSLARAEVVRWAFEYRVGYDLTSVTVQGAGSTELVSKGETEAARAPNRRVEIILQNAEPKE